MQPKTMRQKIFLGILVAAAIVGFVMAIEFSPRLHHMSNFLRVDAEVKTLRLKRPANVTRDQWQYLVGWTINDVNNCLTSHRYVDSGKLARFADELHLRCAGQVDVGTIDWIWDQIAEISPNYGKTYSDRFRPTRPENLAQASYVNFSGLEVN